MRMYQWMVVSVLVSGCASIPVRPGAEAVRVTKQEPGADCRFLGEATGSQGNVFSGAFTSNAKLEDGARNDLKNQAAVMGGNWVVLITERSAFSGSDKGVSQTSVVLSGNVFRCPI